MLVGRSGTGRRVLTFTFYGASNARLYVRALLKSNLSETKSVLASG